MATESIWTALPTGVTRTTLRLSVHVAPRLTVTGGGTDVLASFPAFASWPPSDLTFDVTVGATTYPSTAVTVTSVPDPSVWEKLFPTTTTSVESHTVVDRSATPIHTYPLTKVLGFLRDRYTSAAVDAPETLPAIVDLLAAGFQDVDFSGEDGLERFQLAMNDLTGILGGPDKVVDTNAPSATTFDFVQLEDFFAPLDPEGPGVEAAFLAPVELPTIDFHRAVQFVNQHPPLLRLLGLVLDLEVDTSAGPPALGATTVSVQPSAPALVGTTVRTPSTAADLTSSSFAATPRPTSTHLVPGWLRLEDATQFEVIQVEADGASFKAVDFAGNLGRRQAHPTTDTPTAAALPSLRSDGLAVARPGKAKATRDELVHAVAKETDLAADSLVLHLDDIIRGQRIDVWDSRSGEWHSLMERTGQYALEGGSTVIPVTDEGFIGNTATKKLLSDDLYVSEEICLWDGWSLVVPRPGRTLTTDPTAEDPLIERPPNEPGPDIDVRIDFDIVPGSLPRLRYGTDYRLRARLVDLAGNSVPASSDDDTHATPPVTFGRFEPAATPPVLLRHPVGPGESVETVALRADFDAAPVPTTAQRHLVPAKVGQLTVEQHGRIDNPDPDPGAYAMLAARDEATLLNHPAIDPGTGDSNRHYDTDDLTVTWTPDPLARKLAVKLLDGQHAGHLELPDISTGGWPSFDSVRLVLEEGGGTPSYDPSTQVLSVPLRKADIVHARLSAAIDPAELMRLGLWHWVLDGLPGGAQGEAKRAELEALVANGQHWMFEPFRILKLVHAVRRPLARPEFPQLPVALRSLGDTFARIAGPMDFDRKSTATVDVLASWEEPVDDGPDTPDPADVGQGGAKVVERERAFRLDIDHDPALDPTRLEMRGRHEFGDTKHRVVTYRGMATTRFAEYFTSSTQFSFDGTETMIVLDTGMPATGLVPGSVKLSYAGSAGPVPLTEGPDFSVDADTATVTFGDGSSGALPDTGTTIDATYLARPVTRETADPPDPARGEFGPRVVSVPSSSRPQAPRVRYALPTYGWTDGDLVDGDGIIVSNRHGNGLRVYLERPWWSSGEGELLGVVTWPLAENPDQPDLENPNDPAEDIDARRPYVTQWGQDPIFGSRLLPTRHPKLATFPSAVDTGTNLTLDELSATLPVHVAGHTVAFDENRKLWFCDIDVDPGAAYSPFIRLALARWQPESIADTELSRVVLADFVQLAPDRFASVAFDDAVDTILTVALNGPTHTSTEASDGTDPGPAHVILEERIPSFDGELAWTQVGDPIEMTGSIFNGEGQWFAEMQLAGPRQPDRWRLVIEQFELLGTEPAKKDPTANPFVRTTPVPVPRLVHSDVIPI